MAARTSPESQGTATREACKEGAVATSAMSARTTAQSARKECTLGEYENRVQLQTAEIAANPKPAHFHAAKQEKINVAIAAKVAQEVRDLIQLARAEAERAAECMREARRGIGFAGTTRDDVVVDLQNAGASLVKANASVACAQRAFQRALTGKSGK